MTASILDRIFAARKQAVADAERNRPLEVLREQASSMPPARDFGAALRQVPYSLIAEVKKGSPSKGVFDDELDPVSRALAYDQGGAAAISVVTEPEFFYGSLEWLDRIRTAVPQPLLRKDFIFSPYQIWEARAAGADAVLLILAMLDDRTMEVLLFDASDAGLQCLVEVHDEAEARRATSLGVNIVGVNNRDLNTFEVSLAISERLIDSLPPDAVKISESGIFAADDCRRLHAVGYNAFLVGEALVTAADPAAKLRELRGADAAR